MVFISLAEHKATAYDLERSAHQHPQQCRDCRPRKPCPELTRLRTALKLERNMIRTWFEPGPDQLTLI